MFDRVVVASENLNNVINQKPAGEGTTGKLTPTPGPSGEVKQSGWAWLIVLGSFFIHVLIDGMAYTFGVYTTDLVQHYGISRQSVGWINSALVGLTFVYGPIASKMSELPTTHLICDFFIKKPPLPYYVQRRIFNTYCV